ncbi:hypothetical protein BH20ACT23_BH20ACT23_02280 [soil metagenome]
MVLRPVLKVGDAVLRSRTITARDIELFIELTGDRTPFTRAGRASRSRFRGSIVQGK